jgi:natural product biosynthesis luciferase-like monooxygenase protein/amino acid adenylation domain-containing protein
MKREVYGDWVLRCSNHVELLRSRALDHPEKPLYTFLTNGEEEGTRLTFAELDTQARAIAALLQEKKAFGERVLLLYQPGLEYLAAFFGCLYAGAIAVPAYPPRLNHNLERLEAIVSDAQPMLALSSQSLIAAVLRKQFALSPLLGNLPIEPTDLLAYKSLADQWREPVLSGDTLAFLQYTSGSTGKPKGVMVSHRNLLYNHRMIQAATQNGDDVSYVSWLPLFHDMGLIGNALQTAYRGIQCIFMAPTAFLQKPLRWLEAISHYRASMSYAPNFAYDLCVQKITPEQRATLDLSCWHIAVNSSEPIRSDTLKRFAEAFAPCGFRREAFRSSYGLAEATLCVSSRLKGMPTAVKTIRGEALEQNMAAPASEQERNIRSVVGCGHTWLEQKIMIVDPDTCIECPAGYVGEIWLSGPNVTQGYWRRPAETQEIFHAHLANTGEGPFLRTGDLGFMQEGELYITGRRKGLIIIRGQNYYPQDIEATAAQSHAGLLTGGGAVFSLPVAGEERVILVQEIERIYMHQLPQGLFEAIRQKVLEEYDLSIYAIVLIKPGGMTRTSSGKVQRYACREALLKGTLSVVFTDMPASLVATLEESRVAEGRTAHKEPLAPAIEGRTAHKEPLAPGKPGPMQFSLLYFSSNEAAFTENKYALLLEGAKFADKHDFTAVWIPERHFHPFGGLYPNPSVLAGALATITEQVRLRAGSVVLPLHDLVRVAEEWAVVDNLSAGRVDIAFATGWNPNDFVLAPSNYAHRKEVLFSGIETVQKLWQGGSISLPNGVGQETTVKIYPLPKQAQLRPWITCSGSPERFVEAGAIGANVLTALLFQSREELAEKISAYRESLACNGYDPASGHVTLMMHTFIGEDIDEVREKVRQPFIEYLESSVNLWRQGSEKLDKLSQREREQILSYAFERYFHTHALFGTPQTCEKTIEQLSEIGVNEIASLIDFGMDTDIVIDGLYGLNSLRKRYQKRRPEPTNGSEGERGRGVTLRAPVSLENGRTQGDTPTPLLRKDRDPVVVQAIADRRGPINLYDLLEVTAAERQSRLQRYLQQQVALILERNFEDISGVTRIRGLGLDSLMTMSIINKCQSDLHITLDAGQFYHCDSFASLAQYVTEEFDRALIGTDKRVFDSNVQLIQQPRAQQTFFPLSYSQQRLWFLHQLQPDTLSYNVPTAISIEGDINKEALTRSLEKILQRHESLRTTFTVNNGLPVQVVTASMLFSLPIVDLEQLAPQRREAEMHRLVRQQAQLSFDLVQGPLIRMHLLCLSKVQHVLLFTYHHIIMDGWSRGVLIRELQNFYTSAVMGNPSSLGMPAIQYADFAVWQRQWLESPIHKPDTLLDGRDRHEKGSEEQQTILEKQLAYWKEQLGGRLPVLEFPPDQSRPPVQTSRGLHHSISLSERLMEDLKVLSQREEVSLFMLLLASFQVLLMRYTRQEEILVGTPVAGRNRLELEPLIGFFVNTLVMRTDLSGHPSFREVLQRVRDVCLAAYAHQDVPFEKVVEAVRPQRDMSRHPFFQVVFVLEQDAWRFETDLPGAKLQQLITESGLSTFDLTWSITSSGKGEVEYNTDLFTTSMIVQLVEHWQVLLEGIVSNVNSPVARLPLLTWVEHSQVLRDLSATQVEYASERCLPKVFEDQVRHTPDIVALVCGSEYLTYERLNKRANQLAHYLYASGVERGSCVGVCLERSCDLLVALLAIFKIGAVYVPLDLSRSSEHLAFILANGQLSLLITHVNLEGGLPQHTIQAIHMPVEPGMLENFPTTNLNIAVDPMLVACVIYTTNVAGLSTGMVVPHHSLLNQAVFQKHLFPQQEGDRILQFASCGSGVFLWEITMALLVGATLSIASAGEEPVNSASLVQVLNEQRITTITLPAATIAVLPVEQLPHLETVIAAGEGCSANTLAAWAASRRFFNTYGLAESGMCATIEQYIGDKHKSTIGSPVANVQVYVLDAYLQPQPTGVVGELFIGGAGLAYNYHNDAALTAEKFVPHPFARQHGERLYKTGDLGRCQVDGSIECLGSIDRQVKIRDQHIETQQIEHHLLQYPYVKECLVIDCDTSFNDKMLLAYVVMDEGRTFSEESMRMYLQRRLPVYMVPANFVLLEQIPLTPGGKIDRQHLPAREREHQQVETMLMLPSNEAERAIAAIWQESLHVEKVGRAVSFFELGGYSLLVIEVQKKLQEHFQREIALVALFEYPTVSALAGYLSLKEQDWQVEYEQLKVQKDKKKQELKMNRERQKEKRMRKIKVE